MAEDACQEGTPRKDLRAFSREKDLRSAEPIPEKGSKPDYEKGTKKVEAEADDCNAAHIHVLVVDDNLLDRKIVERLVKNASFKATVVESGTKALEVLASVNNNINLIITDYCMPELTGYDLLRYVKEKPFLKDIPVVIMSSENVPTRIQSCLEDGAEEFILKPVRPADVKRFKSYVRPQKQNLVEQPSAPCKKRKFTPESFQAQSPERGPRIGRVTVA